jgi:hypothetical protein
MKKTIPKYLVSQYGDIRTFKSTKRQDLHYLKSVMKETLYGCAFTPAYREIVKINVLIKTAVKKLSIKEWGR